MDHNLAHETYAAERYLLGEMAPEERDEFEEHFFSCRVCGEEVQTASLFVENAKALFRDESLKPLPAGKGAWLKRDWLHWLRLPVTVPAFAALVLASIVGYQNIVVIPGLRVPRSMDSAIILDGETRSSQLTKAPEGEPLYFQMSLVPDPESNRVRLDVINAAGKTVLSEASVAAPGLYRPLEVYFPGRLAPGRYTVIAWSEQHGKAGRELARDRFEVTPKGE
jgi:hypothetical protein